MFAENDFIRWLKERNSARGQGAGVELGIGDDTAVVRVGSDRLLATSDLLSENIHFDLANCRPWDVGWKSLAVNISDIAAMGGAPTFALLSLGIRRGISSQILKELLCGFEQCAQSHCIGLVGGDTNVHDGPLVISVTLLGKPHSRKTVTRKQAQPGDIIMVTGPLGDSLATQKHLRFNPRVAEAKLLLDHLDIHAMMDLSDGLGADLPKLCTASNVGAKIFAEKLPLTATIAHLPNAVERALNDGEDFELLLTLAPEDCGRARDLVPALTEIGLITRGTELTLERSNICEPWPSLGFEHNF